MTLPEEMVTENSSTASTMSSSRMLIVIHFGGLPTVSPGSKVNDILTDAKSRLAKTSYESEYQERFLCLHNIKTLVTVQTTQVLSNIKICFLMIVDHTVYTSLISRPTPSFSMLHAEKREGLVDLVM